MRVHEMDEATMSDALDRMRYGADSVDRIRDYARGRITYDIGRRELYSYGRHFPLCRYVPARLRGRACKLDLFVINGDRWSGPNSRTSTHQAYVRGRIERVYSSAESVVIPFTALDGAGIDIDSIRVVHARADANWNETRTARSLEEMPLHARHERYSVELEAPSLELVPARERETWREPVGAELETGHSGARYLPLLPGADGLYRWTESRTRAVARGEDGLYSWDVHLHRLGDSLFTAVREISYDRPPDPLESSRDDARVRVALLALGDDGRPRNSDYCERAPETAPARIHETGPSGACIHCGAALAARETWRRRALYLSSFDTNEPGPLYFLAEVPRHPYAPDTVESALDALAPRAVHAATARGRHVARQGDIFLVDTDLTRGELEARGAVFARLTQWTRDAAPKRGEITYVAPAPIKVRRARARRELAYARRLFLEQSRAELVRAVFHERAELARLAARHESAGRWRELHERHALELASAPLQLPDVDAPVLAACETCGAGIGEPCYRIPDDAPDIPESMRGRACASASYRPTLAERHERERHELQHETARKPHSYALPETGAGNARRARAARISTALELMRARETLRALVFRGPGPARARAYSWDSAELAYVRELEQARARLETLAARAQRARYSARGDRDECRRASGRAALDTWRRALDVAQLRFRPLSVWNSPIHAERRERVRRAVSIYGTAHSATETARVGGAVYVRGIVRHVPDLERGRVGGVDHRPVTLTPERWYLAVRNAVPRQATRRRRRPRSSSRRARV